MKNTSQDFDINLALLEYYQAIGVNMAIDDKPNNHFIKKEISQNKTIDVTKNTIAAPSLSDISIIDTDPKQAKTIAQSAKNLQELEKLLAEFDGCALKKRATQLVFSDGNENAKIMIIGEAPGRDEDIEGKPFVGRSGQLLDKMLAAIGLDRSKVYIANIVAWRPPGNRNPTESEISVCLPFLHRQIELVKPEIILTLGAPAAHSLFNTKTPITKMRGIWREFKLADFSAKALPTFHPAFLLRQPAQKAFAWKDMLSLKSAIDEFSNLSVK